MQKAFDQIVRNHLQKEIQETDLQDDSEEQFIDNLNKCFEEKGILRELQIFLRQRLVAILKESSPEIVTSSKGEILDSSVKLFTDFLISHKLLFTYSVLCSEIEDKYQLREELEKISKPDCETILAELGLSKDTVESQKILQFYFANEDTSLLDSIFKFSSIKVPLSSRQSKSSHANLNVSESLGEIESCHQNHQQNIPATSERDKSSEEILEQESYASIDLEGIRDEIESRLRVELKDKEKELVQNFEMKLEILRKKFELEKAQWVEEEQVKNYKMPKNAKELDDNCGGGGGGDDGGNDLERVLRKQVERNFLIKEAQLRSQIERLMLENKKLHGQSVTSRTPSDCCQKSRHKSHHRSRSRKNSEDYENEYFKPNHRKNHQLNIDEDTIAMLQYRVECQAEEIESLKKVVSQNQTLLIKKPEQIKTIGKDVHGAKNVQNCNFLKGFASGDSDMENFLQESKSRCEQIEKEAKVLEICLVELQAKTRSPSSSAAMVFGGGGGDPLNPRIRPVPPRIPSDLRNFSPTISDQSTSVKYQVYPAKSCSKKGNKLSNHTIGIERIPKPKPAEVFHHHQQNHKDFQRSSRFGKYDEIQHVSFIGTGQKPQSKSKPVPTYYDEAFQDGRTKSAGSSSYPHEKNLENGGTKSSMSVIFFQRNEARLGMGDNSSISDNSINNQNQDHNHYANSSPKSSAISLEKESSIKTTHEEIMEEKASTAGALLKDKLTLSMRKERESRESSTNSKSSVKSQSPPKSNKDNRSSIKPLNPTENPLKSQDKGQKQKVTKTSQIEPEIPQVDKSQSQPPQKVQNSQKSQNQDEPSTQSPSQDHKQVDLDHQVVQNVVKSQSSSSSTQSSLVILAPPPLTDAEYQENFWDL